MFRLKAIMMMRPTSYMKRDLDRTRRELCLWLWA